MMRMSEEPSSPRITVSEPPAASHDTADMAQLRKEVIEARNLIIKTDNLLKNLHAEPKQMIAESALAAGSRAFRQQDWKGVSEQLGRYVELEPRVTDAQVWYHLGSARIQIKEWQGAIAPLESFLKNTGGTKTAQYAGLLLGQA